MLDDNIVADRLIDLAAGNRTVVGRALRRVSGRSRVAAALRLTLARGEWAWWVRAECGGARSLE